MEPDRVECTIARFAAQLRRQDARGESKRGGQLDRKPTLQELGMELVDAWNYYVNHADHVAEAVDALRIAEEALGSFAGTDRDGADAVYDAYRNVRAALNLLTVGNVEGVPEEENEECSF